MNIPGVPEYITCKKLCEFIRQLGIEPGELMELYVDAHMRALRVKVYANNPEVTSPGRYWGLGEEAAYHTIQIAITDTEPE